MIKYNKNLVANAQALRKKMTDEEKRLWYDFLKKLPLTVNRQKNIGNYIVDFFIASRSLVIELDGAQHLMEENKEADASRDEYMKVMGITVLRYSNVDINKNFNTVCEDILFHIGLNANDFKH